VQSGRICGANVFDAELFDSEAFTYVPSVAEGVLLVNNVDSAERGGYRREPEPLQRLSTREVYVVTRSTSGRPTHRRDRQFANTSGEVLTKVNQFAAERISPCPRRRPWCKSSRGRPAAGDCSTIAPSPTTTRRTPVSRMAVS
jgi:hypothetical protein